MFQTEGCGVEATVVCSGLIEAGQVPALLSRWLSDSSLSPHPSALDHADIDRAHGAGVYPCASLLPLLPVGSLCGGMFVGAHPCRLFSGRATCRPPVASSCACSLFFSRTPRQAGHAAPFRGTEVGRVLGGSLPFSQTPRAPFYACGQPPRIRDTRIQFPSGLSIPSHEHGGRG